MPPAKSKAPTTNGTAKAKGSKSAAANGTPAVPEKPLDTVAEATPAATAGGSGKPDKAAYDTEQESIKKDIDALQLKLSAVREKISVATKSGPGNDRRTQLRADLDGIRSQQSNNKTSRSKTLDQLKATQDGIQKKVKDLQAARSKTPFKSVADLDAHVKNLEKQVESGNMKLADEKRALQEMSQMKRQRRVIEGFQAEQDAIEADRRAVDELRKQLDDPEAKAVSDRYDAIKAELDELKKESDEAYAGRSKLFEERDKLQADINDLYNRKRESAQVFRDANDRYWNKVNEDRAKRAEKARAQRAADEAQKKLELAERLREEAALPAFQAQIEDCQTLIDYFSGNSTAASTRLLAEDRPDVVGVPKLELRKVDAAPDEGLVARKKKGEDQDAYFVGGKSKAKGKKGAKPAHTSEAASGGSSNQLNVPLPTLSALLSLSIPPPVSSADVARVVEDLQKKKAWFEANQARVTAENVAKAEADITRITNGVSRTVSAGAADGASPAAADVLPPNGGAERPAEPAPTPQVPSTSSLAPPTEIIDDKLEEVKEVEEAEE